MFNYQELPIGVQKKVVECLNRLKYEEVHVIEEYIEEGGEHAHLFEEMRLRVFVNDLFNRDIKVPKMFPQEDREEIWDKVSKMQRK